MILDGETSQKLRKGRKDMFSFDKNNIIIIGTTTVFALLIKDTFCE